MKWLLGSAILTWVLFWFAYKSADRPGDDFGAAVPALLLFVLGVVLVVIYIVMAFWYHRWI